MRLILIIFALLALYFGWLASNINIHFYDSYQYLNNAKVLSGFDLFYDFTRPPVFSTLFVPLMLAYRASGADFWLERAPYLLMLVLNAAAIWCVFRLLSAGLERKVALSAILLLSLNRVVFHFMPFALPDLFAMGLVALMALSCYRLVCSERRHHAIITGCLLGLSISTKHYLALLCLAPAIFFFLEWIKRDEGRIRFRPQLKQIEWLTVMGICCVSVFLLLHKISFLLVPEYSNQPLFELFRRIVESGKNINEFGTVKSLSASLWLNASFLATSLSLPLLLVVIAGLVLSIADNDKLGLLLAIIMFIHLFLIIVIIVNGEARYFLQIYPAFYYFIGVALKRCLTFSTQRYVRLAATAAALIVFAGVIRGTAAEVKSFTNEGYRNNVLLRLSHYVKEQTDPRSKVFWVGYWFSFIAENPDTIEEPFNKDYYYFYFANTNAVSYYSNRQGYTLFPIIPVQGYIDKPKTGDLIIMNPNGFYGEYSGPIGVFSFDGYLKFERKEAGKAANEATFIESGKGTKLLLEKTDEGFQLMGEGMPFLIWNMDVHNYGDLFMNGMPISQSPGSIKSSAPIAAGDIDALTIIPLGSPRNLFYY
jgi:hypothetical protein